MSEYGLLGKGGDVIVHAEREGYKTMVMGTIVHQWFSPPLMIVELDDTTYKSQLPMDMLTEYVEQGEYWAVHFPIDDGPDEEPPGTRLCFHLTEDSLFDVGKVADLETPSHEESLKQHFEHLAEQETDDE